MNTSVASPKPQSSNSTTSGRESSLGGRIPFMLFMLLVVLGALTLIVLMFGSCSGIEFSAGDFSRRRFSYYRFPLGKFQVTPIHRSKVSNVLVNHLIKNKLIPKNKKKWRLARFDAGLGHPYEADELVLCRYLDQRNDEFDLRWLAWSQDNPKLARAFWPIVFRVANEDLYLLIPDLFNIALRHRDPVELDVELRSHVLGSSARIAAGELQLGHFDRAAELSAFVLSQTAGETLAPGDPEIVESQEPQQSQGTSPMGRPNVNPVQESAVNTYDKAIRNGGKQVFDVPPLPVFDPNIEEPADETVDETDKKVSQSDRNSFRTVLRMHRLQKYDWARRAGQFQSLKVLS